MALNVKLLKVEAGTQSAWATSVEPTLMFMGLTSFSINPGKETVQVEDEIVGSAAPGYNAYVSKISPTVSLGGYVTPEMFPYILEMLGSKDTSVTGVGPYTREMDGYVTGATNPRIMTFVYGDANSSFIWKVTGLVLTSVSVNFSSEGPWTFEAEGFAYLVEKNGAFASPDLPTTSYTFCDNGHTTLSFQSWGGSLPGTTLSCDVLEASLSIETNRTAQQRMGSLMPCGYNDTRWTGTFTMTAEVNADTTDLLQYQLDDTVNLQQYQFRVVWDNGAAGAANRKVQFDFASLALATPELIGDSDGLAVFDWEGAFHYNPTLGNYFKSTTINGTSALV